MNKKRWILAALGTALLAGAVLLGVPRMLGAEPKSTHYGIYAWTAPSGGGGQTGSGKMLWSAVGGPILTAPSSGGGKKAWPGFVSASERRRGTSVRQDQWRLYR